MKQTFHTVWEVHVAESQLVREQQTLTDLDIYEAVVEAIESFNPIRETRVPVEVTVKDGVVTLEGIVFTDTMRRMILYAASTTAGVKKVIDRLYDDESLEIAVAQALAADPTLSTIPSPISVSSYAGAVTLHGKVSSKQERLAAIAVASQIPGVRTVIDRLDSPQAD
jgi:osmotically-inducible protein OsmY